MHRTHPLIKIVYIITSILFMSLFLSGCQGTQLEEPPDKIAREITEPGEATYTAYSNLTDLGYARAVVTIRGGDDIISVELTEFLPSGKRIDYKSYEYEPTVKAHQEMETRFEQEDTADVDIYTAATISSNNYKQAVLRALDYSKGGLKGTYYDGKFQGQSPPEKEYGYAIAVVTIEEDKIKNVILKDIDNNGQWRDYSNYEWEPAVKAQQEMPKRFVDTNSVDVDLYTKATQSSLRYKEAVLDALKHASKDPDKDVG